MCTSFRLKAQDSAVVVGRTMEFPSLMEARITVLPRGFEGTGIAPSGDGRKWAAEYGAVGMDCFGRPGWMTDGTNERGLYAGLLYMPGFAGYAPAAGADPVACMSVVNVVAYVLGTCASVEEAKAAMSGVTVWPYPVDAFGFAPPAHLILHDAGGKSAVVEWRDGEMVIFDNPIGVATNSPQLDWHLINLSNYLGLRPDNPASRTIEGVEIPSLGQGLGMRGIPGDASSPSRFVRAVCYVAALLPVPNAAGLEQAALHLLNDFDIPFGSVRGGDDPSADDHTLWSTISSLTARRYAIRGFDDPTTYVVDLATTDFTPGEPRQLPLPAGGFTALTI